MKVLIIITAAFCLTFSLHASSHVPMSIEKSSHHTKGKKSSECRHVVCITIPKSGTHLLHKCLVLFNIKNMYHPPKKGLSPRFILKMRKLNQKPPPNHYMGIFHIPTVGPIPINIVRRMKASKTPRSFWIHWPYTYQSKNVFNKYGYSNFFMVRDPRDQLVSMAFMVYDNKKGEQVSLEKAIIDLIDGRKSQYIRWAVEIQAAHPLMWEYGVVGFYNLYLPWMNAQKFYTVRFEDLVGPQGGGTKEAQFKEIKNIAKHLGLKISQEQIDEISENLFGGTLTFREGKIGSWQEYFTPEIKQIYKQTPGACQLLIDLGYEKDDQW